MISINRARRETFAVLADQMLVSASNLLTGVLLARSLGPDAYGQYALAMGTMLFLTSIQTALIFAPMMVKGPARAEGPDDYYKSLRRAQLYFALAASGLMLVGGLLLAAAFPGWNIAPLVLPLAAAAFCVGMQEFGRRLYLVQRRTLAALINDAICHGTRLSLLWLAYTTHVMDAAAAVWVIAGASAFSAVMIGFAGNGTPSATGRMMVRQIAHEHWAFGKWLLAGSLAYWCGAQLILYVAASLLSVGVVGGMSAALSITGAANVLFLGMENLIPPRATERYRLGGPNALQGYLIRVSLIGGLVIVALMMVAGNWNEYWMSFVFGTQYRQYGWLIWWWGLYHLIGFFQRPLSIALRVLNDTKAVYRSTLGGAGAAILMSGPAIHLHGALGAMVAVCVVQLVTLVLLAHSYRHAIGKGGIGDASSMATELPERSRGLLPGAAV